ncbi:hypothetical protein DFH28DRAFT_1123212 [Melampsora americana]|nr:hypothetical protein DFH28DRAFT_1123212 [Melampsora americana]
MCPTPLDSDIVEKSAEEPWFYMEQAVFQYAQYTSQKDDIELYPSELFPSNKLLISTPQLVTEHTSHVDGRVASINSGTDNWGDYCDASSFNSSFDGDGIIIEIEVFNSPSSSRSLKSLSCYSSESEETNSNGSESTFDSLFEDYFTEHFTNLQDVETPSVLVAGPNDTAILPSEDVVDCDEEEIDAIMEESVIWSRRSLEGGYVNQSFIPLFDGEDNMVDFKNLVDDGKALGNSDNQSHDLNFLDEERQERQLLAAQRYSRAIQLNPHLSHLFD